MRFFTILLIAFLIMLFIEIMATIKKRSKAGEMLVFVTYENRASQIFNLIAASIVIPLYFWIFYKRLKRVVSVLYPQYLDKWYHIFNYRVLEGIRESLVEKGMTYELLTVTRFESGLNYLVLFILWIIIICTYAYDYFGKKGICEKAVFLGRTSYDWSEISRYEWGEHYYRGNKGLKKLHIFIKNGKIGRWLTGNDTMKVNLAVRIEDYEKAEGIFQERITKFEEAVNDKAELT